MKAAFAVVALTLLACLPMAAQARWRMDIPHAFTIYAEPDFRAPEVSHAPPQEVTVLEETAGGWVRIGTKTATGWVNMHRAALPDAISEYTQTLGNNVAVFYKNLDTGFVFTHNPERVFFAASLSKTNHALYTYALAERGYINLAHVHTYQASDRWGGAGILQFEPFGTRRTTRQLLALSIIESDNAAYRMLIRHTASANLTYYDFVQEIGANPERIRNIISQNTDAYDAGLWMVRVWEYLNSGGRYAHYFRYDLENTAQTSHPYFTGAPPEARDTVCLVMMRPRYRMARKYGWARRAFHEAAIIHAPSPFIIVVLTNMDSGAHGLIYEIGKFFEDVNDEWFVVPYGLNSRT